MANHKGHKVGHKRGHKGGRRRGHGTKVVPEHMLGKSLHKKTRRKRA